MKHFIYHFTGLRLYEYFLCQAFQFRERLDATTTIDSRFLCSCVFVNVSFMKVQQKLSELEETNDEGGETSTTASQPAEVAELPVEPTASTSATVRKFRLRKSLELVLVKAD